MGERRAACRPPVRQFSAQHPKLMQAYALNQEAVLTTLAIPRETTAPGKPQSTFGDGKGTKIEEIQAPSTVVRWLFAIMTAMDYAKANLNGLRARDYAVDNLNDTEKARIMYLCHHLGLADAVHFIQNTIPEEDVIVTNKKGKNVVKQNGAKKLLKAQIGEERALKEFVDPNDGSWLEGHRAWLEDFMSRAITPSAFACLGGKKTQLRNEEIKGALTDITEKLKK